MHNDRLVQMTAKVKPVEVVVFVDNSCLVSLALNPGQRKDDRLPGKHLLVEFVTAVFNWWIQIDHLVGDSQLVDYILEMLKKQFIQECSNVYCFFCPPRGDVTITLTLILGSPPGLWPT